MFVTWENLGSQVHVVQSEVQTAYKVCTNLVKTLDCPICCLAVDNAAKGVADAVASHLYRDFGMPVLTLR